MSLQVKAKDGRRRRSPCNPRSSNLIIVRAGIPLVLVALVCHFSYLQQGIKWGGVSFKSEEPKESSAASRQCLNLNLNESMDALLANSRQVFIPMPAKAAGTTMKRFTEKCTRKVLTSNVLQRESERRGSSAEKFRLDFVADSFHVPSIVTSHLFNDNGLVRLSKYPTRQTLIIYIHREETDRLISAVKHVLHSICRFRNKYTKRNQTMSNFNIEINKTDCILGEDPVLKEIARRPHEIGFGSHDLLTCKTYEALQKNNPKTVFVHYKQADKLQKLLAKHHCPELLNEPPVWENTSTDKAVRLSIRLRNKDPEVGDVVTVEDWLHEKGPTLEWATGLRNSDSCQAKTIQMEDELFGCPNEAMRVVPESISKW